MRKWRFLCYKVICVQSGLNSEVDRTCVNQASIGACKYGHQVRIAVIWESIIIGVHSLWLLRGNDDCGPHDQYFNVGRGTTEPPKDMDNR